VVIKKKSRKPTPDAPSKVSDAAAMEPAPHEHLPIRSDDN
jgi:hypothetical protein